MSSSSSSSDSDSEDDERRRRKEEKKAKKKAKKKEKKEKKKEKKREKKEKRKEKRERPDLSHEDLVEARELWGSDFKILSSAARATEPTKRRKYDPGVARSVGSKASVGPSGNLLEHELQAALELLPGKESGKKARSQSKRATYHINRRYAANEDSRGLAEVGNMYGEEDNPMDRRRAGAAASNARVQALMEKMRQERGLPPQDGPGLRTT
jgi:hypothetical protein